MDKLASLTPTEIAVIVDKGTEAPWTSTTDGTSRGSFCCRRCGLALFRGLHAFTSQCGWPSFDDELPNAIARKTDSDGRRTEILCQRCQGHLGHVFIGESLTEKNLRHCVNGISIDFVESDTVIDSEEAIIAGGCFWGIEYHLQRAPGVILTQAGYTGDTHTPNPTYALMCQHRSSHVEAVRVMFDPSITTYQEILEVFFECHDPTQTNGQGPDLGPPYLSRVFYHNDSQQQIGKQLIDELSDQGLVVATELHPATPFWPAEEIHQHYYDKQGQAPYCHRRVSRFNRKN